MHFCQRWLGETRGELSSQNLKGLYHHHQAEVVCLYVSSTSHTSCLQDDVSTLHSPAYLLWLLAVVEQYCGEPQGTPVRKPPNQA